MEIVLKAIYFHSQALQGNANSFHPRLTEQEALQENQITQCQSCPCPDHFLLITDLQVKLILLLREKIPWNLPSPLHM